MTTGVVYFSEKPVHPAEELNLSSIQYLGSNKKDSCNYLILIQKLLLSLWFSGQSFDLRWPLGKAQARITELHHHILERSIPIRTSQLDKNAPNTPLLAD